jgi:hypothetical protein
MADLLHGNQSSNPQSLPQLTMPRLEYVGLSNASYEVIWIRKIILAILPDYTELTVSATTASQPNHAVSSRSKHIDVRFHIIREAAANGLVRLEYIRTADMTF